MAGGVGSRFWPFSRADKPKQFLDFFGTGRSLLQMTVDRFRPIVPIENVFIVTNVAYKQLILEQVPDLSERQILCEPARRNTAPCIAYATAHIRAICLKRAGLTAANQDWNRPEMQANIVVAASDHLILEEEKFRQTILKAFDFVSQHKAICTLGMEPTRPETGYGYIQYIGGLTAQSQHIASTLPAHCQHNGRYLSGEDLYGETESGNGKGIPGERRFPLEQRHLHLEPADYQ